ncbi:MAG: hypothetical protein IPH09_12780 [bacterium]|nr:hypothetical protein [bacterium]
MKNRLKLVTGAAIVAACATSAAGAPVVPAAGWVDRDRDGRHDLFRDADGDGVNDVDGRAYAHPFGWADDDGDRLNDRYRDADGDGVNDLETDFRDDDGDGRDDNVLDADGDGKNDVTGLAYRRNDLHGERFGFVRDGAPWVDEDGDGFPDDQPLTGRQGREGQQDRFQDRDGDGLADGCWFQDGGFQHHRTNTGQGGPGGNGNSGHGNGGSSNGPVPR